MQNDKKVMVVYSCSSCSCSYIKIDWVLERVESLRVVALVVVVVAATQID
jgi:hypothetical protein